MHIPSWYYLSHVRSIGKKGVYYLMKSGQNLFEILKMKEDPTHAVFFLIVS